ncbi:MAG: hypothetical protein IKL53_00120 [Lachnospiraceae bacterium]|nr:hypothetical protein [Lachnospiraceae bacterium]
MNRIKKDIVFWILFVIPFIITAVFMVLLPDKVPLDAFDLEGEWGSKYYYVKVSVAMSIVELVYYFGYRWLTGKKLMKITDERKQAVIKNGQSHSRIMMLALFLMITILYFVILLTKHLAIQGYDINMADIVGVVTSIYLSIAWIMMGNYMPRMHEYKDPISKKWKTANPKILRSVNQICGAVLMLCGILTLVITLILRNMYTLIITMVLTLITAIVLFAVSNIVYKKEEKENK